MATDPPDSLSDRLRTHFRGISMRRRVGAALLAAMGVVALAAPGMIAQYSGQRALNERGAALIDESLETNQNTFLAVSGIKAGVALLEGSTVGVGVEVQVGDLIQPVYDYVDFFWNVFLYSLVVLATYNILLETGMLELGILLAGLGAILFALGLLTPARDTTTPAVGRRCILLGLLFAYVAPASLMATDALSARYTESMKQVHYEAIAEFEQEVERSRQQFVDLREQFTLFPPSGNLDSVRQGFVAIAGSVAESFRLSLLAFLYYSLLVVFDLLFFPFVSAWVLYKVAQVALDRALYRPINSTE